MTKVSKLPETHLYSVTIYLITTKTIVVKMRSTYEDMRDKVDDWAHWGIHEMLNKKVYRISEGSICYITYKEL